MEIAELSAETIALCERAWDSKKINNDNFLDDKFGSLLRRDIRTLRGAEQLNDDVR